MITHRNLLYAIKLAEHGNYRRAANSLNITHSALVRSMKTLEDYLGVILFNRGGGIKVTPTEIGEVFIKHAKDLCLREEDLIQEIQLMKGVSKGELSVAFGPYPGKLSGHTAVRRLISKHPDLKVKTNVLDPSKAIEMVMERQADLGVTFAGEVQPDGDLNIKSLEQHVGVFFCRPGHPLLKRNALKQADLFEYPWAATRLPKPYSQFLPRDLGRAGKFDPLNGAFIPAIQLDQVHEMADIVAKSDILGVGALLMFIEELKRGELTVVPYREAWMRTDYSIIYLKYRTLSPAASAFIDEIMEVEKGLNADESMYAEEFLGGYATL